jgi:DNA-binding NarL/FixJ family response regulator
VLRIAEQHKIDLLLLDIEMPELSGYETAKLLLAKKPMMRIIIHTMHDGQALTNGLLHLGVKGFILKQEDTNQLEEAIHSVMRGEIYVSPKLSKLINKHIDKNIKMDFTPAEKKLVKLLSKGLTNEEISTELAISIRSVETYRYRLIKRLKVANSLELVEYFHSNGLF